MKLGKWASWCRTAGHSANCSCVYPTHLVPGRGEKEMSYEEILRRAKSHASS